MRRPLRIILALRDARSLSGATTVARELAAGAAKAGHVVRLLSARPPRPRLPGVSCHRVAMLPFSSTARAWSFDLAARLSAKALRADIVHGHGDLTAQDVLTVNNVDAAEANYTRRSRVGSAGTLFVRKRQFDPRRVRRIVTVSKRAKKDLERFYHVDPFRVDVIYLGVDSRRFTPEGRGPDRKALLAELRLPSSARLHLSLISGDPQRRNVRGLLEAFARARLGPEHVLLIVGDPSAASQPDAPGLERAGKLKLMAKTSEPERIYRACDSFLLPAHYETFGMTALEAMASGLPAAVTSHCGVSELLDNGANALVIDDSRDPVELAAAFEKLADPKTAARLAAAGTQAARRLGWGATVSGYLALYERVHREKTGA